MDESIRPKTPAELEADCIAADLANNENKAQERNAMRLQRRQYSGDFA
jgi:hypothetical protein